MMANALPKRLKSPGPTGTRQEWIDFWEAMTEHPNGVPEPPEHPGPTALPSHQHAHAQMLGAWDDWKAKKEAEAAENGDEDEDEHEAGAGSGEGGPGNNGDTGLASGGRSATGRDARTGDE